MHWLNYKNKTINFKKKIKYQNQSIFPSSLREKKEWNWFKIVFKKTSFITDAMGLK